jgi:hypothetical protein
MSTIAQDDRCYYHNADQAGIEDPGGPPQFAESHFHDFIIVVAVVRR